MLLLHGETMLDWLQPLKEVLNPQYEGRIHALSMWQHNALRCRRRVYGLAGYKVKLVESTPSCRITKCELNHNRVDLLKVLPAKSIESL